MNVTAAKNPFQVVFISHHQTNGSDFLISLLKRHPGICVFESNEMLMDNLLKYPSASFSAHNTVFFELIFDLVHDSRFNFGDFSIGECDEISKSKNCYEAFQKLLKYYKKRTKPAATIMVYRFQSSQNFNMLFSNYIVKDLNAKYIHVANDMVPGEEQSESASGIMLSSIYHGLLQVKQRDFIEHYEYEYKRLFTFLNAPEEKIHSPIGNNKKTNRKSPKLKDVQNSWYNQVADMKGNITEERMFEKVFHK